MKQVYKLRALLLMLLCSVVGAVYAESETITFKDLGYSNATTLTTVNGTDVTLTFTQGTANNPSKYYDTGSGARMYKGNSLTVASAKTIEKIEFTFDGTNTGTLTASVGTYSQPTWTGSASTVTFSNTGSTNRIQAITVTFVSASGVSAPTMSVAAGKVAYGTEVELACTTTDAKIYYTTDGTDPTNASTEYTSALKITSDMTIKAIAYVGDKASSVASAAYKLIVPDAPTVSKVSGAFADPFELTITPATGCKVVYGIGSDPKTNPAIAVTTEGAATLTISETCQIYAYSVDENGLYSTVNSPIYTKTDAITFAQLVGMTGKSTSQVCLVKFENAQVFAGTNTSKKLIVQDGLGLYVYTTDLKNLTNGQIINGTASVGYVVYDGMPEIKSVTNMDFTITDGTIPAATPVSLASVGASDLYKVVSIDQEKVTTVATVGDVTLYNQLTVDGATTGSANPWVGSYLSGKGILFPYKKGETTNVVTDSYQFIPLEAFTYNYYDDQTNTYTTSSNGVSKVNVKISCDLKAGVWNAVALPVTLTADDMKANFGEGYKLAYLNTAADGVLEFKSTTGDMGSGTPYLLKPAQDVTEISLTSKTLKSVSTTGSKKADYTFKPTFNATTVGEGTVLFVEGEKTVVGAEGATLKAFTGYLEPNSAEVAAVETIKVDDEVTTAIAGLTNQTSQNAATYNLAGQRVGASYKGIVVKGGKKIIVK